MISDTRKKIFFFLNITDSIVLEVIRYVTVIIKKEHTTLDTGFIDSSMQIIQNFNIEHLDNATKDDLIYLKEGLEKTISDIKETVSIINALCNIPDSKKILAILSQDASIASLHLDKVNTLLGNDKKNGTPAKRYCPLLFLFKVRPAV